MTDYKKIAEDELEGLRLKAAKLSTFISDSEDFKWMDTVVQECLISQRNITWEFYGQLCKLVKAFKCAEKGTEV